jgi:hypothetical protein
MKVVDRYVKFQMQLVLFKVNLWNFRYELKTEKKSKLDHVG